MNQVILNDEHLAGVLGEAMTGSRHRLFIATANVKDLHLPVAGRRRGRSIVAAFDELSERGVEVRLLHGAVPSGAMIERLKTHKPARLTMRRCVRMHAKVVVVDGRLAYIGSANLTGAGLGAKSARRRNFEAGLWTDRADLIDPILDMLDGVWQGLHCADCGRRPQCPVPLEEPDL